MGCSRGLYGRGVYFTTDSCKAQQYCGNGSDRTIILARVLLGHPYITSGPLHSHDRPPIIEAHGVPYDSTLARPGTPKGKGKGKQLHWEFVVQRGDLQAYPELLIRLS